MSATDHLPTEERLRRAEAALEEALAERNRLWEQLNQRAAAEHELAEVRRIVATMQASPSWRLTRPLRDAKATVVRARALAGVARARLLGR